MRWRVLYAVLLFALGLYAVGEWIYSGFYVSSVYSIFRVVEIAALLWGGMAVLSNRRKWMLAAGVLALSWGLPAFITDSLPFVFDVFIWTLVPDTMLIACLRALGILLGICVTFTCFGAIRRGERLHRAQWVLCFAFLGVLLCDYWGEIALQLLGFDFAYLDWTLLLSNIMMDVMYFVVQAALFSILPFYLQLNKLQLSPDRAVTHLPAYTLYRNITAAVFVLGMLGHFLFLDWDSLDLTLYPERQLWVYLFDCIVIVGYLFLLIQGSFKVHQTHLYRGGHGVGARFIYWIGNLVGLLVIAWLVTVLYPDGSVTASLLTFAFGGVLCWIQVEANRAFVQSRTLVQPQPAVPQQAPVQTEDGLQYAPPPAGNPPAAVSSPASASQPALSNPAVESSDQSLFAREPSEQDEAAGREQQAGNDVPPAENDDVSLFHEAPPPAQAAPPPTDAARFCRYCGAALPAEDCLYCPACGKRIRET